MFTAEEYFDMIMCYGEARGSAHRALRLYREKFPNRRHPANGDVIVRAAYRIRNNLSVVPINHRESAVPMDTELILQRFREDPGTSTRVVGRQLGLSHTTVHKVLKKNKRFPYRVKPVQALSPADYDRRVEFCNLLLDLQNNDPNFIKKIIWSDESLFTRNGLWNRRTVHFWARKGHNPRFIRETSFQNRWTINVWAGIIGDKIIGPVFINGTLNRQRYMTLLRGPLANFLDTVPLADLNQIWFQHDGAPPHIAEEVRNELETMFGNRWIGRHGPILWPPRSPDLTILDFFFWGWVKNLVYRKVSNTETEMRVNIISAFNHIRHRINSDPNLMNRVHNNIIKRLRLCVNQNGRQIEHLKI